MTPRHILCIDDSETCNLYDLLFTEIDKRFRVTSVSDAQEAIDLVKSKRFDLYILEPFRPDFNGIEFCKLIRQIDAKKPVVFYSGMSREVDRSKALAAGASDYFVKASDMDKFIDKVREYLN